MSQSMNGLSKVAVVLAAGKGTRMKSNLPKVLHEIAERSLVAWSVTAALDAGAQACVVVVGHEREAVEASLIERFGDRVSFALQAEQNGTGHAVQCAMESALMDFSGQILVTYGDCPLLKGQTLASLFSAGQNHDLSLLVAHKDDPTGYGRIVRKDGRVAKIVEQKDATEDERAITEVNPGIYCFEAAFLRGGLSRLNTNNAQGELYLTDLVEMAERVCDVEGDMGELRGVNDKAQLAECDAAMRRRLATACAQKGVSVQDLDAFYIGADCEVEAGATIKAGVHLRGQTTVRAGAFIDAGCVLTNVQVAEGAQLLPYTVASDSTIGQRATVGPFSNLRPKSHLGEGSKVGNFSETKNTQIGKDSKINHLSYVGDGVIGEGVNVGAGVIFCNYDGIQKHTTTLEDGVFVGSDSQLVAPVTVGKGAYVASGSTVTKDVPTDALAISRTKQVNKDGYASRIRTRMEAHKKRREEEA